MKTTFYIYRPGQERETREIEMAAEPGYVAIRDVVLPLLEGATDLEHVSVLFEGMPTDMFVDELGAIPFRERGPLPVNEEATAIYHAAGLRRAPRADTSTWPQIHGTAVVFARRIWF